MKVFVGLLDPEDKAINLKTKKGKTRKGGGKGEERNSLHPPRRGGYNIE